MIGGRAFSLLKQSFSDFFEDRCFRMAAALAFYTLFALGPLLVLIVMICSIIWDPSRIQGVLEQEIQQVLGADGAAQVKTMLESAAQSEKSWLAGIFSTLMLIFGATGLVGQLQYSINDAWGVEPDPRRSTWRIFLIKRLVSFAMICAVAFLLLVSLVLSSLVTAAGDAFASVLPFSGTVLSVLDIAVSLLVIVALFAAMFKFLPDADVRWSDVGVGALITALLFVVGKYAIGAYLGSKNMESAYGAAGSLALVLIWVYYSSIIFFFGVEFTQAWARQRGSGVKPSEGAVRVERRAAIDGAHARA